mmetsp:Transcript_5839/g.11771  ORF Transcript_5839/g.11771 Transcript_5839/m.11771 type:complete len:497 (-) Transcript_5839:85-1575(-)
MEVASSSRAEPKVFSSVHPSSTGKVTDFLEQIKGLSSFSAAELKAELYKNRFELLPAREGAGQADSKAIKLPCYDAIPTQRELHDVLIAGAAPHAYQCIAHVVRPDVVPWPEPEEQSPESREICEGVAASQSSSKALSESGSPHGGVSARRSSSYSPRPPMEKEGPTDTEAVQLFPAKSSGGLVGGTSGDAVGDTVSGPGAELVLCGQKITKTARGINVAELGDYRVPDRRAAQIQDEEKLQKARQKRMNLERTVKIEQFREKLMVQKIRTLEGMKVDEMQRQERMEKKEAQRKARREQLKKQLDEQMQQKIEEEKAAEEAEKVRKAEEKEAKEKERKYYEKQKESLEQWYSEAARAGGLGFGEARAKLRREEMEAQEQARRQEREQNQRRTVKQLETEAKRQRIRAASEERPPLPPRPHDLPRPVLDLMAGDDAAAASAAARHAPARPTSWTREARVVSGVYGLSVQERSDVERHMQTAVQGAGRMGTYEKQWNW